MKLTTIRRVGLRPGLQAGIRPTGARVSIDI